MREKMAEAGGERESSAGVVRPRGKTKSCSINKHEGTPKTTERKILLFDARKHGSATLPDGKRT